MSPSHEGFAVHRRPARATELALESKTQKSVVGVHGRPSLTSAFLASGVFCARSLPAPPQALLMFRHPLLWGAAG